MKAEKNRRRGQLSDLGQQWLVEETPHFIVDQEDPPCAEYVLMSEQRSMPALQEYLHELHAHGAFAYR